MTPFVTLHQSESYSVNIQYFVFRISAFFKSWILFTKIYLQLYNDNLSAIPSISKVH